MKKISYNSVIEKEELKNQIASLSSILSQKENETNTFNAKLAQKDNKINSLNSELISRYNALSDFQSQLSTQDASYKNQIKDLQTQLVNRDNKISTLESQIENKDLSYEKAIKHLNTELEAKENQIKDLQTQLSKKEEPINTLQEKSTNTEEKVLTIDELKKNHSETQKANDIYLAEKLKIITELEADLQSKKELNESLKEDIVIEQKKVEMNNLLNELQQLNLQKFQIENDKMFISEKGFKELELSIENRQKKISSLNQQINNPLKLSGIKPFESVDVDNQNPYPNLNTEEETELAGDNVAYQYGLYGQH